MYKRQVVWLVVLVWVIKKIFKNIHQQLPSRSVLETVVLLLITAALIIPIRGGLQLAPINQSSVYFSDNAFANQAALNTAWNFMYSASRSGELHRDTYAYFPNKQAEEIIKTLNSASILLFFPAFITGPILFL